MVRNFKGGNKGKKGARRRNAQTDKSNKIRYKKDKEEIYAKVLIMHGNGAEILCEDDVKRFLVWRKKFTGRNKRDNSIHINAVVLAGLRDWEVIAGDKKPKADLLFVYSKDHINELFKKKDIPRKIFPDEMRNGPDIDFKKQIYEDIELDNSVSVENKKINKTNYNLEEMINDI